MTSLRTALAPLTALVRQGWQSHPFLTGLEVLVALVLLVEVVFVGHILLALIVGAVTRNRDAMSDVRFVFMTGSDAKFFAGFVGLLALLPATAVLFLASAVGWAHASYTGNPTGAFITGLLGALGAVVVSAVLILTTGAFGGGILPH